MLIIISDKKVLSFHIRSVVMMLNLNTKERNDLLAIYYDQTIKYTYIGTYILLDEVHQC